MQTAVIGLGAMGAGMAANLHRAGLLACAWNRTPARAEAAAAPHGYRLAATLEEAAASAELVITSVSADQDLFEVAGRLKPALQPGAVVLDTSTVSADAARRVAADLAGVGVDFLDGPVSGGKEGAEKGTMVMMVGGDPAVLERIRPALEVITGKLAHMGPVGAGQATKAVNQIMVAGINQAVTEALAFGGAQGLDLDKVIELLGGGAAGNWFLSHRGPTMIRDTFTPGFRLALHHKDLKICQAMAAAQQVQLPCVEMTLVHYQRLMEAGYGDEDISALFRSKKALFAPQDRGARSEERGAQD
jgi:3-hydroxyisobutyrate dehydrogenase